MVDDVLLDNCDVNNISEKEIDKYYDVLYKDYLEEWEISEYKMGSYALEIGYLSFDDFKKCKM